MKTKSEITNASPLRHFYFPHSRAATGYTGMLRDHVTGKYVKPVARTKQEFRDECDINNVIRQYKLTGQIQHINMQAQAGAYTDLPDTLDFQDALELVRDAQASFATLPSKVRDRFNNNPAEFLAFVHDPSNIDEARNLGLLTPKSEPVTPAADPSSPPPPPPSTPPATVSSPAEPKK